MKKQYEQPKAEKLEFDYEETVVASKSFNDKDAQLCQFHGKWNFDGKGNGCNKVQ